MIHQHTNGSLIGTHLLYFVVLYSLNYTFRLRIIYSLHFLLTEFYALTTVSKFSLNKYFIATDPVPYILFLNLIFLTPTYSLVIRIKTIIFYIHQSNYQFLWVSAHIGILDNEVTDKMTKAASI